MKSLTEITTKIICNFLIGFTSTCVQIREKLIQPEFNGVPRNGGVPIVLTASMIEMSDFNLNPFIAFSGGFPLVPPKYILRKKLYPSSHSNEDETTEFAPYGLRKVEALLIEEFGQENVATVHPQNLSKFIGSKTKVVGISSMDPLGMAFVSRTYTSILGLNGKPATRMEFEDLFSNSALRKYEPKIIVGGSGAWQLLSGNMQDKLGIDTILIGQIEHSAIEIFRKMLDGEKLDKVITAQTPQIREIPIIRNPSIYGTVEITRGCGRGCSFCSPTMRQRYSFPLEHILREVKLNARNGTKMILLQTDDVFLYESKQDFIPNRKAIVQLIQSVNEIEGVDYIQITHASLAPIVYDRKIVEETAPILLEKSLWHCNGKRCVSIEVGIETGSAQLMKKHMSGKMFPYEPEVWQDIVVQSIGTLNDNYIYPLATMILGLPGEQEEDILDSLTLLDKLEGSKIFYVPLLFTSEEESILKREMHKDLKELNELQWDVLSRCWRHNLDLWAPKLKIAMFGGLLAYPYYRWKHGKKIFAPIMKFSGLEELFLNRKSGKKCHLQYCTSNRS